MCLGPGSWKLEYGESHLRFQFEGRVIFSVDRYGNSYAPRFLFSPILASTSNMKLKLTRNALSVLS